MKNRITKVGVFADLKPTADVNHVKPNYTPNPVLAVRAGESEETSWSEGLKLLNTKGALVIPVRLTKNRAQIILSMVHRYRHEYNWTHEEDNEMGNEMQSAMQWIVNQINKKWSQNELYSPDKRKGRHDR